MSVVFQAADLDSELIELFRQFFNERRFAAVLVPYDLEDWKMCGHSSSLPFSSRYKRTCTLAPAS